MTPVTADHIGEWYVELEQVRTSNGVTTVYTAGYIIVDCTILTWTPPTMPTTEESTYYVFDDDFTITLAPAFDQQPPCAYTADMYFTWTIPSGAPIYRTADNYSLLVTTQNVDKTGIYTVFLDNEIIYDGTTWNERVSYNIEILNPCENTELVLEDTTIEDMEYAVGETQIVQPFTAVTDTITAGITTGGNCGNIIYTLTNLEGSVGTEFVEVVDLVNDKGIKVFIEDEEFIGYWNITMKVRMEDYNREGYYEFAINITAADALIPEAVSFPPILRNDDLLDTITLEPGEAWEIVFDPFDSDDDLATIDVIFDSTSALWLEYDQASYTLRTAADMSGQDLGTYQITVLLEDLLGNASSYPVLFQIECLPGSFNELCPDESEAEEETVAAVIADTDVTEITSVDIFINIEISLDYDVVETIPISELVEPADPALEEEGFEDVEGVLSAEQGAEAIEDITSASDEPVEFDETLIPTGGVAEITAEVRASSSAEEIRQLEAINEYATAVV